jgi:hypothetical protein
MNKLIISVLLALVCLNAYPADVTLRTAIYRYHQPIYANSTVVLRGQSCDIMQLVLDVESGYTNIKISDGGLIRYPDRILAGDDVFAYSLYSNSVSKGFSFEAYNPDMPPASSPDIQIGTATIFGYCFSSEAIPTGPIDINLDDTKNRVRYFPDGSSQAY